MPEDSLNNYLSYFLPFYTNIALKYDEQENYLLEPHKSLVCIFFHAK